MTEDPAKKSLRVHIDRVPYEVHEHELTGELLRALPNPSDRVRLRPVARRARRR